MENMRPHDYTKRFWIGAGVCIYATLDTLEAVDAYLARQSDLDRHFCKIYDHDKLLLIDGSEYAYRKYGRPITWRKWN